MNDRFSLLFQIDALDDLAAVTAAERLAELFAGGTVTPPEAGAFGELQGIVDAASRDASEPLDAGNPATLARELVKAFATDPDYAVLVELALSEARDSQLMTKPILALGVAASLIIVAASTDVKIEFDNVSIHKTVSSPELVESATSILLPIGRRSVDHQVVETQRRPHQQPRK